jgi:hypothetical protein
MEALEKNFDTHKQVDTTKQEVNAKMERNKWHVKALVLTNYYESPWVN